jgi:two-component sensor histidine kinase
LIRSYRASLSVVINAVTDLFKFACEALARDLGLARTKQVVIIVMAVNLRTYQTPAGDLLSVVESLAQASSTEEIIEVIRSKARRLVGSDGIALILRDEDRCHYIEEDAVGPLWKGHKFTMTECISGWSMIHSKTAVIPDVSADERIPFHLYRDTFVRSLVMAPIGVSSPVGALGAYWSNVYEPTQYEIETVETLARCTATALENAYLVAALSRALSQAELARDELRHRVKNSYLAAQALGKMSLPVEHSEVFSAHIAALGRAHELIDLKLASQSSIKLAELMHAELEPYAHDAPDRLSIRGPDVTLESAQAVALGLAVNELATNALKYGALAAPKGRLNVEWRVDGNHLILNWRETNGLAVRTAALESFGSRLLRRLVEGQLAGSITRRLQADGVVCVLEFPLGLQSLCTNTSMWMPSPSIDDPV